MQTTVKAHKFFFVYVLGSRRKNDRRTYVGWTTDLNKRLQQHNAGCGAKSTRGREWILPVAKP
jgi:putative endonuclease